MADIEYGGAIDGETQSITGSVKTAMNWFGALVSVALIAGLAYWGYQLMVRDVSGVPVVRALEGPMRIAPERPGGQQTEHQGLAVNSITAEGEAQAPADRLVLAPAISSLAPEDETQASLQERVEAQTQSEVTVTPDTASTDDTNSASQDAEPMDQASLIQSTLLQLTENQDAVGSLGQVSQGNVIPTSVGGVSRSQRPLLRPAVIAAALPAANQDTTAPDATISVDPASIPAGTRLAQLGAFETIEIAKSEWLKFSDRFEDVMAGKAQVIEQAQSGGKVFYRLRAHGFENLSEARQFCSTLLAGQANCIPVVTR